MNKKTFVSLFSTLLCLSYSIKSFALPKNHEIASGNAEFTQVDSRIMEVRPSDKAIINYSNFDIGKHEKVKFIQSSSSSCVLNRVKGNAASEILGSLESNGKVFLVNPSGIYFGPDSHVNVGSLIASTLDIKDTDFLEDNYQFNLSNTDGVIRVEGLLESIEGSIALMAPQIQNLGTISAKAGTVALLSGEHVTLDFTGDGLLQFSVEGTLKDALIEQLGDITASLVQLKIPVAKKAISEMVNLDGIEEGDIFIEENGIIKFASSSLVEAKKVLLEAANLEVKGSIDASSFDDIGGEVHLFGRDISLDGALIDASGSLGGGEVLIGGEYQGKGKTPWASKVSMNESSEILVNAIYSGDGGLAVLWSKDQTSFNGKIFAQGGKQKGNGGLVETSSYGQLNSTFGYVNTLAENGSLGQWLLDPQEVYIVSGSGTNCSLSGTTYGCPSCNSDCLSSSGSCNVDVSTIESASSDVTIRSNLNIHVNSSIEMQNESAGLVLQVCSSIGAVYLNSNITTKSGLVNFSNTNGGYTLLGADVTINTTGSDGSYSGANILFSGNISDSGGHNLILTAGQGTFQAGSGVNIGGALTVNSAANIKLYGTISPSRGLTTPADVIVSVIKSTQFGGNSFFCESGNIDIGPIEAITAGTDFGLTVGGDTNTIIVHGDIGTTTPFGNIIITAYPGGATLSSIETNGGNIVVDAPITLNSNATFTSNGGNISVGYGADASTSSSRESLTLVAGSGEVGILGPIGSNNPIGDFTVTSASSVMLYDSIFTAGSAINIIPDSKLVFTYYINPGIYTTLDTTQGGYSSGGNISLSGVSSSETEVRPLTCIAGSSTVTIGAVSNVTTLSIIGGAVNLTDSVDAESLAITNTGLLTASSGAGISLSGNFVQTQYGGVSLGQSITANSISFSSPISISDGVTLISINDLNTSSTDNSGSSGITFGSTIDGAYPLTIQGGSGAISIAGAVGGGTSLSSLAISSGSSVALSSIMASGSINITPPVTLNNSSIVNSGSGGITFGSTIDGAYPLTIQGGSGAISIPGAVGGGTSLSSFAVSSGSSVSLSSITASGSINITPPVTLNNFSVLSSGSGDITFGSTIDGAYPLVIQGGSGAISLVGALGGGTSLSSLEVSSGASVALSSITASGSINITPPVTLNSSSTVNSGSGGITFGSTIDGAYPLDIQGGSSTISIGGSIGGGIPLSSFKISSGSQVSFSSINTSGEIQITPKVVMNEATTATSTAGPITFLGDVSGPWTFSVEAGAGSISLSSLGGSSSFISDVILSGGAVTLNGPITTTTSSSTTGQLNITNLDTLTINTPSISLSGVFIQNGAGGVSLAQDVSLMAVSGISFSSNILGTDSESLTLISTDSVSASSFGTSTNPLGQLSITAINPSSFTGIFTNTGSIDIDAPLSLSANSITVDSSGGNITFLGTINGSSTPSLSIIAGSGNVLLQDLVGNTTPIESLTITGNVIQQLKKTIVTSDISYTGTNSIEISSDMTSNNGSVTITGPLLLSSEPITVQAQNDITLETIDTNGSSLYPEALTLTSTNGTVSFGTVGGGSYSGSLPLLDLTVSALDIDQTSTVNVTGNISYTASSSINLDGDIATTGGSVTWAGPVNLVTFPITVDAVTDIDASSSSINGLNNLTLNSTAGTISLSEVGNTTPIGNLAVIGLWIELNGDLLSDKITLTGDITLFANNSMTANAGPITLNGSLNASKSSSKESLTLDAGTDVISLIGSFGNENPLGAITVASASSLQTSASIYTAGGAIEITPPLQVTGPTSMTTTAGGSSSSITFFDSVDSYSSTPQSLELTAGSSPITFSDDIGSMNPLENFSIVSASEVYIKNVTVSSDIDVLPHIILSDSLTSFSAEDIALGGIDGTASGMQSITLTVNSGSGSVALGTIGANTPLNEVQIPSGLSAIIQSIITQGAIEIDIPIVLAASSTLSTIGGGALGTSITLKAIDGISVGGESLTITTGIGDVTLTDKIGYEVPLGNLDVTGNTIAFEGTLVSVAGEQSYNSPVTISQSIEFYSLGNITFNSTLEPASGAPNLTLYPGSGVLTFAASVGDAPFGMISVYNAGSFVAQDIVASALQITGGLPSATLNGNVTLSGTLGLYFDGGPLYLGGDITASGVWLRSRGNQENLGSSSLNISGNSQSTFDYLNAIDGVVGSLSYPIEINTAKSITVGSSSTVNFTGTPFQSCVDFVDSNPPSSVIFNGVSIYSCGTGPNPPRPPGPPIPPNPPFPTPDFPQGEVTSAFFHLIPKDYWYITWTYSSWDNFSNLEFFEEESVNPGFNKRDLKMFYANGIYDRTDPRIEDSVLNLQRITPVEQTVDKEFKVEFSKKPINLDMSKK